MRIGVLQFGPHLGEPERNRAHADSLLGRAGFPSSSTSTGGSSRVAFSTSKLRPGQSSNSSADSLENGLGHDTKLSSSYDSYSQRIDLLVLPEMAFSGYNFTNLDAIKPYLEPTATGTSAQWAARTARRCQCLVAVGYPETTTAPEKIPRHVYGADADSAQLLPPSAEEEDPRPSSSSGHRRNFNSLVVVDPNGVVCAHYRKTHLYYTDSTWAEPSPEGFISASLPLIPPLYPPLPLSSIATTNSISSPSTPKPSTKPTTTTSFAICMDLNPQYFTAPWTAYEAASAVQRAHAPLLVASNAWITSGAAMEPTNEPDWDTLAYWLERLRPLLDAERDADAEAEGTQLNEMNETLIVVANRTGIEPGVCRAFELDPAVRAAKQAERAERVERRRERRQQLQQLQEATKAARTEASIAAVPGSEPVMVDPPPTVDEVNESDTTDEDEDEADKGKVFLEQVRYAGSSAVFALGAGRARVWGVLGRAEEGLLVVDTKRAPVSVWRLGKRETERGEEHG